MARVGVFCKGQVGRNINYRDAGLRELGTQPQRGPGGMRVVDWRKLFRPPGDSGQSSFLHLVMPPASQRRIVVR
jgi:hypothetical protein